MSSGLVVVEVFTSTMEAEIARTKLEESGVPALVLPENAAGWRPGLEAALGVELRVASEDFEAAHQILSAVRESRRANRET